MPRQKLKTASTSTVRCQALIQRTAKPAGIISLLLKSVHEKQFETQQSFLVALHRYNNVTHFDTKF